MIGIISAAWRVISAVSSGGSRPDGSGSDAYRHTAAYGRSAIDARAMDATVIDPGASNATSSIGGGVS